MSLNRNVASSVRAWVGGWPEEPPQGMILRVLRYLCQWRSIILANTYVRREGPRVHGGLFEGMAYVAQSTEGALMPRLLGTYEAELHPHIRGFLAEGVDCIVDVGCAEGYYAVGLARLDEGVVVHAHDVDPAAQAACAALAERNGVAERVRVGGVLQPQDFEAFAGRRTLAIVDIEGGEGDLLRPDLSPALRRMPIIVETHDLHRKGVLAELLERFSASHHIERVDQKPKVFQAPAWMDELNELDRLIAVWEWRVQPTPWLVMRPKAG